MEPLLSLELLLPQVILLRVNKHFHISCFVLVDIKKTFLYPQCSPLSALEIAELCCSLIGAVCSWGQIPGVVQRGERYTGEGLAHAWGAMASCGALPCTLALLHPLPGHLGSRVTPGGCTGRWGKGFCPPLWHRVSGFPDGEDSPGDVLLCFGVARLWAGRSSVSPRAAAGARHLALLVLAGSECLGRDHSLLAPGLSEGKPGFSTPGGLVLLSTQRG